MSSASNFAEGCASWPCPGGAGWRARCFADGISPRRGISGQIVYAQIEMGEMQKVDEDSIDDFKNVYDFETAFESHYRIPESKMSKTREPRKQSRSPGSKGRGEGRCGIIVRPRSFTTSQAPARRVYFSGNSSRCIACGNAGALLQDGLSKSAPLGCIRPGAFVRPSAPLKSSAYANPERITSPKVAQRRRSTLRKARNPSKAAASPKY